MQQDPREYVRMLTALAGIPITAEHIAAVALALPLIHGGCEAVAGLEYGDLEPAPRFHPPQGPPR